MKANLIKQEINVQPSIEVLTALSQGSHEAYSEIYLHYQKPVCNFIYALTHSREDAEDITHEVFINVWKNCRKLAPEEGINRYLFAIAKNLVMRYFRQKKIESNYLQYSRQQSVQSDIFSDELLLLEETGASIEMVMSRMPRIRKQIFEMYYKGGLSYDRIADKLGMNKATVANHLSNAKNDIRKVI